MRVHSLSAALLGALAAGAVAPAARAEPAADPATAKTLFDHGRDLRSHGNCADALPLFQKAYALYPRGLGSLRNIAVCQEALGHFASARSAWLELRRTVATSTDPKYAGWVDDADRAMAHLAPKVPTLTVDLLLVESAGGVSHESAPPDDVAVTVDGETLARERLGAPIDHDPGTVVVRAAGPSIAAPEEQTVVLAPGESKHVALRMAVTRPASEAAAPAQAITEPDHAARRASRLRTEAWVALGVGAAGLAGAAVSFAVRQSAMSDVEKLCPSYASQPCAPSNADALTADVNRGRTASTLLNVFGAAAIVGSVTGVTLFAMSRSSTRQTAVILMPGGVGATGTF